jgi:predicted SprT family Zn-dependent metalloprotease
MAFDDFMKKMQPVKKATPQIVEQTFDAGQKLINVDYFDKIKDIQDLKPFLLKQTSMNVFKRGWRFQFGTSKSWAGLCNPRSEEVLKSKNKNIMISIDFVKGDDKWNENMTDVILHEIAHAIVFEIFYFDGEGTIGGLMQLDPEHFDKEKPGHGKMWKQVASALQGKQASTFYINSQTNKYFLDYTYNCVNCGFKGFGATANFVSKCQKCLKPVFIQQNS